MSQEMKFTLIGRVVPKGRPRAVARGNFVRMYTPASTEKFEESVKQCVRHYMMVNRLAPFTGAIHVSIDIEREIPASWSKKKTAAALAREVRPISVPDLDNEAKSILDALNKVAYLDDNQVVKLSLERVYAMKAQAHVTIQQIDLPNAE